MNDILRSRHDIWICLRESHGGSDSLISCCKCDIDNVHISRCLFGMNYGDGLLALSLHPRGDHNEMPTPT